MSDLDKVIENYRAAFDIETLHIHSMHVTHAFIAIFGNEGIKNNDDRIVAKNMHAQVHATKFLLDEKLGRYKIKMMLKQTLKRMEEKISTV